MSFSSKDNSCKAFAPNIFNKNKCQNCFRPRETHLQSSKDLNKAKPIYGGWLLLAPIGTDFNNPMHKNRKWQRRWFVLFEHGALRYALDDNLTTVAQGTIDMNRCAEVMYADTITDQKHSLCLCLPDQKWFVRGENREDIMGWYDQLVVYPETIKEELRLKKRLFKRKSEGPRIQAAAAAASASSYSAPNTPLIGTKNQELDFFQYMKNDRTPKQTVDKSILSRSRNSSTSSSVKSPSLERGGLLSPRTLSNRRDVVDGPISDASSDKSSDKIAAYAELKSSADSRSGRKTSQSENPSKNVKTNVNQSESKLDTSYFTVERKTSDLPPSKTDSTPSHTDHLQRHMSISTSSLDSTTSNHSLSESTDGSQTHPGTGMKKKHFKDYQNLADVPKAKRISNRHYQEQKKDVEKKSRARSPGRDEVDRMFGKERRRSRVIDAFEVAQADSHNKENTEPPAASSDSYLERSSSSAKSTSSTKSPPPTLRDQDLDEKRGRAISRRSTNMKQGTQTEQSPRMSAAALRRAKSLDRKSYDSIQISADLFNVKKGWLTKQKEGGNWGKHWFVLGNKELRYYQDSSAEDASKPDGVVDLQNFKEIFECDVQRNYGFKIKTSDDTFALAAMTSGIRKNWINAIVKATNQNVTVEDGAATGEKPAKTAELVISPSKATGVDDLSVTERTQRRRAKIRDRRKEGRARTFDFAEFRPLAAQARGMDPVKNAKAETAKTATPTPPPPPPTTTTTTTATANKSEGKARSRTFDADELLKDLKSCNSPKKAEVETSNISKKMDKHKIKDKTSVFRLTPDLQAELEEEWKKLEKSCYGKDDNGLAPITNPMSQTVTMVKALQEEVDSLKQQMERVDIERTSSIEDALLDSGLGAMIKLPPGEFLHEESKPRDQEADKLKQELSLVQEALRKQNSQLRDCGMQLDISLSESQVIETQLANAQSDLLLEKSRREEDEKEHARKVNALSKELEESDAQLKKSENLHLESQRKIRDLERQVNMQKDHNKEETLLQEHIAMLRRQAEDQEGEMKELQEAFEERCQNQKQLEDSLSQAKELIQNYEKQLHDLKEAMMSKDNAALSSSRNGALVDIEKLAADLKASRVSEEDIKDKMSKLLAQNQGDKNILQNELDKEREACQRLRGILKEHDDDFAANEKQLLEMKALSDQLARRIRSSEESKLSLERDYKELSNENRRLKEQLTKSQNSSQQTVRELRTRLTSAEKELGDIEEIRQRDVSPAASSFKAKLTELEAEMGGTGQMIAARLLSLEPSRRVSDPSISTDKESSSQKVHRLEVELEAKNKKLLSVKERLREMEERETEAENEFTAKLHELRETQRVTTADFEATIAAIKQGSIEADEKLAATQHCLSELYKKTSQLKDKNRDATTNLLTSVLHDTLKLSTGDTSVSTTPPRSPSPDPTLGDKQWGRVTDAKSRQQHQRAMSRLRQLTEQLKSSDGRLVSPSGVPASVIGQSGPSITGKSSSTPRPDDLPVTSTSVSLSEDSAAHLFAKQISTQALLLAEMATTLRRTQSTPVLASLGRGQPNFKPNSRQTSPQLTAAEFSDTIAHHTTTGGLLQHVDTLAQKLTLEGMLMSEVAQLKEVWLSNRSRGHRNMVPGVSPSSELSNAMVTHAHINYVIQIYNERISRLSLEARQARHRADAVMQKLRELVHACKTQDLEAVSNLAVQVDTDSIAPPYSDRPTWEQQVDYGTLHGAQSVPSPTNAEVNYLDQEANFFHHLADDLQRMSANVESLAKLGAQLVMADSALQKFLHPSEIGDHASIIAREAIVQAEVIYISHRLRRDYDGELRKAKNAVLEQSSHLEALNHKLKHSEESWSSKLKHITDEHKVKVEPLMQQVSHLEDVRAEMLKDVEEKLTRLSKKHKKELTSCKAKHEEESASLKKDLSKAKTQLETKTKDYMDEVKSLTQRLEEIKQQHKKESIESSEDYNRRFEKARGEFDAEVAKVKKEDEKVITKLKNEFVKEMAEVEKDFSDKLTSIETAKKDEMEALKRKNRTRVKSLEAEHKKALETVEQINQEKMTSLKRDFDELLQQEKSKNQMEQKRMREDTDSKVREQIKQKTKDLKKEHEKILKNRDRLHKEQLEREKEIWTKELREKWEEEIKPKVSHTRSGSLTSESDSKDALKERISSLEEQLTSMQGKLKNENHRHSYQQQLDEIKTLCDQSFASIEETHAKLLEEKTVAHRREVDKLKEEHAKEIEENNEDTRRAIESLHKHHLDELCSIQNEHDKTSSGRLSPHRRDQEKLEKEIETLSEYYSQKCVELANALEEKEKAEDRMKSLERGNSRLLARQNALDDRKFENEVHKLKSSSSDEKVMGDVYQLQVMLRVKSSEINYLKQEVTSLNQQLEECFQDKKQSTRKHQGLFEKLTLSRSKEGLARRETSRLKERLRSFGDLSDEESNSDDGGESTPENSKGYDFQKSRSQPHLPANKASNKPSTSSQVTSSTTSIKRRSSEKAGKHHKA